MHPFKWTWLSFGGGKWEIGYDEKLFKLLVTMAHLAFFPIAHLLPCSVPGSNQPDLTNRPTTNSTRALTTKFNETSRDVKATKFNVGNKYVEHEKTLRRALDGRSRNTAAQRQLLPSRRVTASRTASLKFSSLCCSHISTLICVREAPRSKPIVLVIVGHLICSVLMLDGRRRCGK